MTQPNPTPPAVPNYLYERFSVADGVGRHKGRAHIMHENYDRTKKTYLLGNSNFTPDKNKSSTYSYEEANRMVEFLMEKPRRVQIDKHGQYLHYGDPEFVNTVGFTPVYKNGVVVRYEFDTDEAA